jgi:hypothetical protein
MCFAPDRNVGVGVPRRPRNPALPILEPLVDALRRTLVDGPLTGCLWMVEPGRIRVHQTEAEANLPE